MVLTEIFIGFILATVGVASMTLAATYWAASGPTLLSFGTFALLYGARLLVSVVLPSGWAGG